MASESDHRSQRYRPVVLGALVGVALGVLVSVTTDIPFAPEAGLLLGGLLGWFWAARLRR